MDLLIGINPGRLIKIIYFEIKKSVELGKLLLENENRIAKIFEPAETLILDQLEDYYFILRDLRAHDVFDIAKNIASISEEIFHLITGPITNKNYIHSDIPKISSLARSKNSFRVASRLYGHDVRLRGPQISESHFSDLN